jgi:hypothetical protein
MTRYLRKRHEPKKRWHCQFQSSRGWLLDTLAPGYVAHELSGPTGAIRSDSQARNEKPNYEEADFLPSRSSNFVSNNGHTDDRRVCSACCRSGAQNI